MGEVRAKIVIQNLEDVLLYKKGYLKKDAIREIELDSLADTGVTEVLIPQDAAESLGIITSEKIIVSLAGGNTDELSVGAPILIKICGREWIGDCLIGPPLCEPLLGQLVMERLDLVVNPRSQTITVNPTSPFLPHLKLK